MFNSDEFEILPKTTSSYSSFEWCLSESINMLNPLFGSVAAFKAPYKINFLLIGRLNLFLARFWSIGVKISVLMGLGRWKLCLCLRSSLSFANLYSHELKLKKLIFSFNDNAFCFREKVMILFTFLWKSRYYDYFFSEQIVIQTIFSWKDRNS